jgi:UDP-N-acetylglucosamine 2-epimerase
METGLTVQSPSIPCNDVRCKWRTAMKLKEYAAQIARLAEKYPEAQVVYSIDEEGNLYKPVLLEPEMMKENSVCCVN